MFKDIYIYLFNSMFDILVIQVNLGFLNNNIEMQLDARLIKFKT